MAKIRDACSAVSYIQEAEENWPEHLGFVALQAAVDKPDDEESFYGAGHFIRKDNIVWRMQYGGTSRWVLKDAATAGILMEYLRQVSD